MKLRLSHERTDAHRFLPYRQIVWTISGMEILDASKRVDNPRSVEIAIAA